MDRFRVAVSEPRIRVQIPLDLKDLVANGNPYILVAKSKRCIKCLLCVNLLFYGRETDCMPKKLIKIKCTFAKVMCVSMVNRDFVRLTS